MKAKSSLTFVAAALLGLTACGGGGGGTGVVTTNKTVTGIVSGITTTSGKPVLSGAVPAANVNGVTINGVQLTLPSNAQVLVNGVNSAAHLAVGMMVSVQAVVDATNTSGTANKLTSSQEVYGPVLTALTPGSTSGTMTILGQTVNINGNTLFESTDVGVTSIDQVIANDVVEVNGYTSGHGQVWATRVKFVSHTGTGGYEFKTIATNPNGSSFQATGGATTLTVNYTNPGFTVSNGTFVKVRTNDDGSTGTVTATQIELEGNGHLHGDPNEEAEVEGIVTFIDQAVPPTYIELNGIRVVLASTNNNTNGHKSGSTRGSNEGGFGNLVLGSQVKVEGQYNAAGELVAKEVKMEEKASYELQGAVTAVDPVAKTVTVLGQTVTVDVRTMMHDGRPNGDAYLNLSKVVAGDRVKLRVTGQPGALIASNLDRRDAGGQDKVQGIVQTAAGSTLTVLGVTVNATGLALPAITAGSTLVKVYGTFNGTTLTATSIATAQADD